MTNDLIIGAERVNDRLSVGWKKKIFRYKPFFFFHLLMLSKWKYEAFKEGNLNLFIKVSLK